MNGINCRRLMKHHDKIIDIIRLIFINMSKIVYDNDIHLITKKDK